MKFSNYVKSTLEKKIGELAYDPSIHVQNSGRDFTRERKLNFSTMMKSIVCMGVSTTEDELLEYFNYDSNTATTSAFVQQRDKIKSSAFETLFQSFNEAFPQKQRYKGYRLIGIDGSTLSIYADPKDTDNYQIRRHETKGFSSVHLNASYDLLTRRYTDAIIQNGKKSDERLAMREMVSRYQGKDDTIFIADRGYESYNNFASVMEKGKNFLIRVKDRGSNGILSGLELPPEAEFDIDVKLILTRKQTKAIKDNPAYKFMPTVQQFDYFKDEKKEYTIQFRVIRFKLSENSYEAIITNLCHETFSSLELKKLYHLR